MALKCNYFICKIFLACMNVFRTIQKYYTFGRILEKILKRRITQREPRMRENNLYPFDGDPVRKRNRNRGRGSGYEKGDEDWYGYRNGNGNGNGNGDAHVRDRGAE